MQAGEGNKKRRLRWLIGGVAALVVAIPVGTWLYIHVIEGDAPERLSIDESNAAQSTAPLGDVSGAWAATPDSQVGYRVKEVLFKQDTTAVGRTNAVTGTLTIAGSKVNGVDLTVDVASMKSDQANRDNQFRGRIMSTAQFPTATFRLDEPITLPRTPDATPLDVPARGTLTLRGVAKSVSVDLRVRQVAAGVEVNGTIPITFADWGIPNPSFGPAQTEDKGDLELLVVFKRQG